MSVLNEIGSSLTGSWASKYNKKNSKQGKLEGDLYPEICFGFQEDEPIIGGGGGGGGGYKRQFTVTLSMLI